MRPLLHACTPRQSVFDTQRRDTVLDISDLIGDKINPAEFFEENYVTEGMKILLEQGFRRLEGNSQQGVFKLKQAMGGGKTHNLLTLGLLAKHPEYRQKAMGSFYQPSAALGAVKVVAFSGRESDAPLGLWGSIAEQLGKKGHFKDLYSPLQAPGQTAWETLLAGETVLILLDELAPYFENAHAKAIGNSDLAHVTATALSNLLVAVHRESCARVCLVISDLARAYEGGTAQIFAVLADFENETHRTAMTLEPVRMNSDELYSILRKRLFASLPPESEIVDVSQAYARAIRDARQMDITNESPERFAERVQAAYPFHPAIRDLYARFRENQGFQQTRGLIRLMRIVVSRLWNTGMAEKRYLISAHDLDFNDRETRAEISQINSTLENAIAHDIASDGSAVAEVMDANLGGDDAQDACRLLMMASLANVPNAILGLAIPQLVAYLAEPGRDLARLRSEVLAKLSTAAWYLHSDQDGKLFFRNTENLIAKLESLVRTYLPEQALKELRNRLADLFRPVDSWCYQKVLALPAVDEIELSQDDITLVITEPQAAPGLRHELNAFWEQVTWKNRLAILTGPRNTYETLLDSGKRLKAIQHILDSLKSDHVPDNDPQMMQAKELSDRIRQNFHSAVRETFTTLWYPIEQAGSTELAAADFSMLFEGNLYSGEGQIKLLLTEKMKFTTEVTGEIFRKKCEQRLFTAQSLPWSEIKRRAGMLSKWQWHHPRALDELKADCLQKDLWREQGGYVDKGPFPQPKTSINIQETNRDDNTGEATLRITPVNADTIYYDIGAQASTASAKLDGATLKTRELRVSFLAVDSSGVHETGEARPWVNRITLKHRQYQSGSDRKMEIVAAPMASIHYTTDGSDPKVAGATYEGPFIIPYGAPVVMAYGERDGVLSEVLKVAQDWKRIDVVPVDPRLPATWKRPHKCASTKDTYDLIEKARKYHASLIGITITISGEGSDPEWIELTAYEEKRMTPELLEESLGMLRKLQTSGQVRMDAAGLYFESGQDLLDWVEVARTEIKPGETRQ